MTAIDKHQRLTEYGMTLRPLLPAILLALVMSIVVGVLATGRGSGETLAVAVGLFAAQMLFAITRVNAPFFQPPPATEPLSSRIFCCAWRNTVLAGLIYAWGATAMLAIYSMSSLNWRHWWQYGAGMAIIAAAIFIYAYILTDERSPLRSPAALRNLMALTAAQGIAMGGALFYIFTTGKLATKRDDWVANYIFVAGCLLLALLSLVAILAYRALKRQPSAA
jgi:hypothetical protein